MRTATPADASGFVALVNRVADHDQTLGIDRFPFTPEQEAQLLASADPSIYLSLVAVAEAGHVIGVLAASRGSDSKLVHVSSLAIAVDEHARGTGVGSALLDAFFVWARAVQVRKATLSVLANNAPAIRLFLRHGFLPEATRRGQLRIGDDLRDELLMARWLPDGEVARHAP